jgi:hypothetical protein
MSARIHLKLPPDFKLPPLKLLIAGASAVLLLLLTGHYAALSTSDTYGTRVDTLKSKLGLGSDGMAWSGGRTTAQKAAQEEWMAMEAASVRPCPLSSLSRDAY